MGWKLKGDVVVISGKTQIIEPCVLPQTGLPGQICLDSVDELYKVWSDSKQRWITLGDASDIVFDNSGNGFISTNVQDAIEEAMASTDIDSNIGNMFQASFTLNGSAKNKWLSQSTSQNPSNQTPFLTPWDCRLVRATMSNKTKNADTDIEIYSSANGDGNLNTLAYTWNIRTKRVDCVNPSSVTNLEFDSGDKLAIFARDKGNDLKEVIITLYFKIITNDDCVGESYSSDFNTNGTGTGTS